MAGLTLPGIRDLDLPLRITKRAVPSPPLTPNTQSSCPSHGGWQSRRSSVEETPSEALTLLSRSALYHLEPRTDHESRRSSTVSTSTTGEQLPSIFEFVRGVCEMGAPASLSHHDGLSRLPTPPMYQAILVPGSPDSEQSVPWSRSRFPDDSAASEFASILRTRKQESCGWSVVTLRDGKPRHKSGAGVKKPKKSASGGKKKKRNNQEYTPIQECFVIYHKVEKKFAWPQIKDAYNEWNMGSGEPFRTKGALSCIYYRTNFRIPVTSPDGLLDLRWEYGEEVEARIEEERKLEYKRLKEEQEREEEEEERIARENGSWVEVRIDEVEDEWNEEMEETEHGVESFVKIDVKGKDEMGEEEWYQEGEGTGDGMKIDEKDDKKTKGKDKKKKKTKKKIEVPYPYSVHWAAGVPAVEYRNSSLKVRDGG